MITEEMVREKIVRTEDFEDRLRSLNEECEGVLRQVDDLLENRPPFLEEAPQSLRAELNRNFSIYQQAYEKKVAAEDALTQEKSKRLATYLQNELKKAAKEGKKYISVSETQIEDVGANMNYTIKILKKMGLYCYKRWYYKKETGTMVCLHVSWTRKNRVPISIPTIVSSIIIGYSLLCYILPGILSWIAIPGIFCAAAVISDIPRMRTLDNQIRNIWL